MQKRMIRFWIVGLAAILLCGCERNTESVVQSEKESIVAEDNDWNDPNRKEDELKKNESEKKQDTDVIVENQSGDTADEGKQEGDEKPWGDIMFGSIVLEDDSFLYLCSLYQITKVDKSTGESEVLWESKERMYRQREYYYADGCGIVIGEMIYFLEEWMDESPDNYGEMKKAFSMIRVDGTDYQRLREIYVTDLLVRDEVLYLNITEGDGGIVGYSILADGSLDMEEEVKDKAQVEGIPAEYTAEYYTDNGSHALSPAVSLQKLGYYLMHNENYELVRKFPESGEEELLTDGLSTYSLHALNSSYLLMSNYENDKRVYYLVDKQTLDKRPLMEHPWSVDVITMDDKYVYFRSEREGENNLKTYPFERVDLETGEATVLFEQAPFTGLGVTPSSYMGDLVLQNGYIYYVGMQDYKLYMMRRSLENLSVEEPLGEAFYDSRIGEVGTVAYQYAEFFEDETVHNGETKPDTGGASVQAENLEEGKEEPCVTVDLEWLVVDERYPGAEKINSYMKEIMDNNISYEKELVEEVASLRREYSEDFPPYSLSSNIYEIGYIDDTYLSYCQAGYEYYGGAHGMPYRTGYTFNLQTGELLALSDVIGNSEEELKEIVGKYFEELISKNPENYWEGSVESVKEWTDLNSDYYLTEEGIRFYQTPYAIASYAAGFPEVTIPYSEFIMKIELG